MPGPRSVSLALLTFKRPDGLSKALDSLIVVSEMERPRHLITEILVIDNDPSGSARSTVEDRGIVRYVHEPRPGVSAARNRALTEASGEILVFIDDDEYAGEGWPDGLLTVMIETEAALVGGPVRTVLPPGAPKWAKNVEFFNRDEPPHLSEMQWLRSGNLAIDLTQIRSHALRFDEAFGQTGGEDVRFTLSAKRSGLELRWASNAVVYEDVSEDRLTTQWVQSRAFTAMSNYVRASAPISWPTAARILVRAASRLLFGGPLVLGGRLTNNPEMLVRGSVQLRQASGAVSALRSVRFG